MSSGKKGRPRYRDKFIFLEPKAATYTGNFKDALVGNKTVSSADLDAAWPKLDGTPRLKSRPVKNVSPKHLKLFPPASASAVVGESEETSYNSEECENKASDDSCGVQTSTDETGGSPTTSDSTTSELSTSEFPPIDGTVCRKRCIFKEIKNGGSEINQITVNGSSDEEITKLAEGLESVELSPTSLKSGSPSEKPKPQFKHRINIDVNEALQLAASKKLKIKINKRIKPKISMFSGNRLDADKPIRKKGKVREVPRRKLLTKIKKAIILSRLKRLSTRNSHILGPQLEQLEVDLRIKLQEDLEKSMHELAKILQKVKHADVSPVLKRSESVENEIKASIHSKKFRSYCSNIPSPGLIYNAKVLVTTLRSFQDRLHNRDPDKAKRKRRYVCGFKETIKFLHLGNIKIIILATNLEACVGDPLEKMIEELKTICRTSRVPIAFAGMAHDLGYWTCKKNRISIIGVLNYQGCEDIFKDLLVCLDTAQRDYEEKVKKTRQSLGISKTSEECKKDIEELINRAMLEKLTDGTYHDDTPEVSVKREEIDHFSSFLESIEHCIRKN